MSHAKPCHARVSSFVALVLLGAAACAGSGLEPPPPEPPDGLAVPFDVSRYFSPSGYMGDGAIPGGIVAVTDPGSCKPRVPDALGDCYRFTYTPGDQHWAGVYWQFPADNWGASEGKKIAPGASKVTFYAASEAGGEQLVVTIGGVKDVTLPFADELKAQKTFVLTTEMTQYTVELPVGNDGFASVIGGFSWTTNIAAETDPATAPPIVLYLDRIVWE